MKRLLVAALAMIGCGSGTVVVPAPHVKVPPMQVLAQAPADGSRPTRSAAGSFVSPSALFVEQGALAVVDQGAVSVRGASGAFATWSVGESLGSVRAMTRRAGGVLLATDTGLFHDAAGQVLRSPLSMDVTAGQVKFLDSLGAGADEVLWVTTSEEASRIAGGHRSTIAVSDPDESGGLQAIIGRTASQALVVSGGSLYGVDTSANTVSVLARGVGVVAAFDRRADGTVWLATDDGLLEVGGDDVVTRRTLAAEGVAAAKVVAMSQVEGALLLTTTTQAVELKPSGAKVLADVSGPRARSVVRDAAGDTWVADQGGLAKLATGDSLPLPVSYATEVKPFLQAHCRSCHSSGAHYAPIIDFDSYATAKQWAPQSLTRLKATTSPMPPSTTEVLTPTQYDVFVRWVDGGLKP